jgi:hypothetical protein
LIVLIVYAHHLLDLEFLIPSLALRGFQIWPYGQAAYARPKGPITFYNRTVMMPSTCSVWSL